MRGNSGGQEEFRRWKIRLGTRELWFYVHFAVCYALYVCVFYWFVVSGLIVSNVGSLPQTAVAVWRWMRGKIEMVS